MEQIEIKKLSRKSLPGWLTPELIPLAEKMHRHLDMNHPIVTATDHHHYRRERNLKTLICRYMQKSYTLARKEQSKLT